MSTFVHRTVKTRWMTGSVLLAILLVIIAGCIASVTERTPSATAPAKATGSPVAGKMLVVKEGNLWLWKDGKFSQLSSGARYCCPAWSPDGRQIAAAIVGDNHSDLVLLDEQGRLKKQLTKNWSHQRVQDCAWARSPAWSPDGRFIAFVSDLRGTGSDVPGPTEVWLIDLKGGGNPRALDNPAAVADVDYITWSPEGEFLAVTGFSRGTGQIYTLELAKGRWTKITEAPDGALQQAWSPDGGRIACVIRENGESDVWVMNQDGTDPIKVTRDGTANAPTWSPDGKQIAYLAGRPSSDLYIISSERGATEGKGRALTSGARIETPSRLSWAK